MLITKASILRGSDFRDFRSRGEDLKLKIRVVLFGAGILASGFQLRDFGL